MADRCVFCGTVTSTGWVPEHWVPDWVSRGTIPKRSGIEHHLPGRDPMRRSKFEVTVEHVCDDCNHHWMSDIESRTRDIALPMMNGESALLRAGQQSQLAAWCFLKAITLELGRDPEQAVTYPEAFYEGFKVHRVPPGGCLVTIGFRETMRSHGSLMGWWRTERQKMPLEDGSDLDGYRTSFTIGHLVCDVLGVFDIRFQPVVENDPRLLAIWPVLSDVLSWPPKAHFLGVSENDLY